MKNVIISLSSKSIAARECFIGVFNYVNAGHDWQMQIISSPQEITPEIVADATRSGVNGIITGIDRDTPGFWAIVNSGLPTAFINTPPNWQNPLCGPVAILHNDETAIGRLGADFFRRIGKFRSYAFVPTKEKTFWSTYRKRGFRTALAANGIYPTTFDHRKTSLEKWIESLPKPAAVMAANDQNAIRVIEICAKLKLKVPDQVAVLGVDNDELYCVNSRPSLSSIHPNHVELGRSAAEMLDRMMRKPMSRRITYIPPIGVIERDSTRTVPPAAHLIQTALDFIRQNFQSGITAKDVARHIGASDSLVRLRFKEVLGRSIRDTLLDIRLEAAKEALRNSDEQVSRIARKCGFSSICRFTHFFTGLTGESPTSWRKRSLKARSRPSGRLRQ